MVGFNRRSRVTFRAFGGDSPIGPAGVATCPESRATMEIVSDIEPQHTTRLLNRLADGDSSVADELLERIYSELHLLASSHMGQQAQNHTLQPTALVHEAFLRLVDTPDASYASQGHFYALASKVMRTVLVDHAREKNAKKRGGGRSRVPLEVHAPELEGPQGPGGPGGAERDGIYDLMDVNEALEVLAAVDPQLVEVVELRHFGGLSNARVAEVLGVSERTVERRLRSATVWLQRRLA